MAKCLKCNGSGKSNIPVALNPFTGAGGFYPPCHVCNGTGKIAQTNEEKAEAIYECVMTNSWSFSKDGIKKVVKTATSRGGLINMTGFEIAGKSIQSLDCIKRELKELKFKFKCISGQFTTFDRYAENSNMPREELMIKYHKNIKSDINKMRESLTKTQELLNILESIIDTEYEVNGWCKNVDEED